MDPLLRFGFAALVFFGVAATSFVVGLQFIPPLGEEGTQFVMVSGMLGMMAMAMIYGPLLAISAALGGAFATYVYGKLGPSP